MSTLTDIGRSVRADIRRVVAPAIVRTQKLSRDSDMVAALRAHDAKRQTEICNQAILASTEVDAVALFDASGKIVAINSVYASGAPIPADRVNRVLGARFTDRDIIQKCVRNKARTSVLEFQTNCNITPAFFDSVGLSVACSAPVIDPVTGEKLGVVSSRLRFERLFDLIKGRTIGGDGDLIHFVTDQGNYFSEEINSGHEAPPLASSALSAIVAPLVDGHADFTFTEHNGDYLGLFRLQDFSTLGGGGIQIMLIAKEAWLAKEARQSRLFQASGFVGLGFLFGLLALFVPTLASFRRLHATSSETAQRLDMALDAGGVGLWDWNVVADSVVLDDRFAKQLGLGPDELQVTMDGWLGRIHPEDAPSARKSREAMLGSKVLTYCSEHRVRHANGSWRWVLDSGKTVARALDGAPLRIVGTQADVTQRKTTELMLSQAQKLESIGNLAAGIAHEINTPTQYVGDNIQFLQGQFGSLMKIIETYAAQINTEAPAKPWPERKAEIEGILKSMDFAFLREEIPQAINQSLEGLGRIGTIVRAMKDFSHPGSETKEPADLNRSITSTIEVCRARWKYVADMETKLGENLPSVPCLVAEFNQVILNLIVNAADAIGEAVGTSGEKRGLIRVSSRLAGEFIEVRVQDDGPGIPEAIKTRMFEQFFTTKPVGKGTGQGLALSRNVIVNKHGGKLTFESTAGKGTTFIIQLPIAENTHQKLEAA